MNEPIREPWLCEACLYWSCSSHECRATAPMEAENLNGTPRYAVWPKTRPNDWCGEFVSPWNARDGKEVTP